MKQKITVEIISFLFIILFVYAAVNTLMNLDKFQVQIGQSPLLAGIDWFVKWLIPISEILISAALAIPKFRAIGLVVAFGLMVMFTAYIISILRFVEQIPCACGGMLQRLGWAEHLIFNVFFILLAVAGIVLIQEKTKDQVIYQ